MWLRGGSPNRPYFLYNVRIKRHSGLIWLEWWAKKSVVLRYSSFVIR